jgi:hypothetical protein
MTSHRIQRLFGAGRFKKLVAGRTTKRWHP